MIIRIALLMQIPASKWSFAGVDEHRKAVLKIPSIGAKNNDPQFAQTNAAKEVDVCAVENNIKVKNRNNESLRSGKKPKVNPGGLEGSGLFQDYL